MKQYLKFVITTLVFTVLLFSTLVIGILKYPADVFHSSYQSMIQDKYRILMETESPKIIVVAGSSTAFGLDQEMLEEACEGYRVVDLGVHAGFGHLFYSELAKANINQGDIVLLGYEYGWQSSIAINGVDLIMSGIDGDLEMYTKIPIKEWPKFIGYLFAHAENKNLYEDATGIYSREAFDSETGRMTMAREAAMEYDPSIFGTFNLTNVAIADDVVDYLTEFKEYVEERGASVYFIAPPVVKDAVLNDDSEFFKLKELEEELIGIPYISDPTAYLFPCEWMSDAMYHCNSEGEKIRTKLLIEDLRRASVIGGAK